MIRSHPSNNNYRSEYDTIDWEKKLDVPPAGAGSDVSVVEVPEVLSGGGKARSPTDPVPNCFGLHSVYHIKDDTWECSRCEQRFIQV